MFCSCSFSDLSQQVQSYMEWQVVWTLEAGNDSKNVRLLLI
jgi:hypothetical protein